MIKRIKRLERVGSFLSFEWPARGLPEFSKFNLIYGWNYSGKTSLSRAFDALGGGPLPEAWTSAKYCFELDDGAMVDEADRSKAPRVEVFNRDYVGRAFEKEHSAPAQFVVGPENAELSRRREHEAARKSAVEKSRADIDTHLTELKKVFNEGLKKKAREINDGRQGKKFEKPQLEARLKEVREAPTSHILDANTLDAARRTCSATAADFADLESSTYRFPDVKDWAERVQRLLGRTASRDAIDQLTKDEALEAWMRSGVALHSDKVRCMFCEGPLESARLARLQRHFSDAYESLVRDIDSEIKTLEKVDLNPRLADSAKVLPACSIEYRVASEKLSSFLGAAQTLRNELVKALSTKQLRMEAVLHDRFDVGAVVDGSDAVVQLTAVIDQHNEEIKQLSKAVADATEKFERHHGAEFFLREDIESKEKEIEALSKRLKRLDQILQKLSGRIETINSRISSSAIGAVELNKVLRCILSDNDISVADANDGRFEFRRGGLAATEMSEGERTAVTFAYFVASLESDDRKIGETIVFVDDPISSLDSNHLYAVYALIIEKLSLAEQLFVSTHSSELFALLKKAFTDNSDARFKRQNSLYYLRRVRSTEPRSQIETLPPLLRKHNSEYEFTFAQLRMVSTTDIDESLACAVPNLLRKFLESYLGFRRPHTTRWSEKLDILIDDAATRRRVQKFADDASHLQRPGKALDLPSYVPEAKACVAAVLDGLQSRDKEHYDSLVEAVEPTNGSSR